MRGCSVFQRFVGGLHGRKIIAEALAADPSVWIERAQLITDDIACYASSFSAEPDLLTQWRYYAANGTGDKDEKHHATSLKHFHRGGQQVPYFPGDLRDSIAADAACPIREVWVGPCLDLAAATSEVPMRCG